MSDQIVASQEATLGEERMAAITKALKDLAKGAKSEFDARESVILNDLENRKQLVCLAKGIRELDSQRPLIKGFLRDQKAYQTLQEKLAALEAQYPTKSIVIDGVEFVGIPLEVARKLDELRAILRVVEDNAAFNKLNEDMMILVGQLIEIPGWEAMVAGLKDKDLATAIRKNINIYNNRSVKESK